MLPLGTGNDLARVLGWGGLCDDDAQLLEILEKTGESYNQDAGQVRDRVKERD